VSADRFSGRVWVSIALGLSRNMALTIPVSTVNRVVTRLEKGHMKDGVSWPGHAPMPLPENLKSALTLWEIPGYRCERGAGGARTRPACFSAM